jgi:DnaJ-class molecular chaperone
MPYADIEDIYETLSSEKQREVYDFIRFLAEQAGRKVSSSTPIESYSDDFSALFGSISDSTFIEPTDTVCNDEAGQQSSPMTESLSPIMSVNFLG